MLICAPALVFLSRGALAEEPEPPIISKIEISGNQRIKADAIRTHIRQQPDQPFDQEAVDADIKAIYQMGFFSDVESQLVQRGDDYVLAYKVSERPQLRDVQVYTTEAIRADDPKVVAAVKVHRGLILVPAAVKETIGNLTQVYADEGYTDAKVTFTAMPQPNNTAVGIFSVVE